METALATVIIGVAVLALVEAHQSFLKSNSWSSVSATGAYLANEVRERMRNLERHDPVTGLFIRDEDLIGWGPEEGEVLATDYDDIDDYSGITFGVGGDFPGPIDAFGNVVPEQDATGAIVLDEEGEARPLAGWTQEVVVEKVDPFNTSIARANSYEDEAEGDFAGRRVDGFPLRVTVIVSYQGPFSPTAGEVTRLTWIAPAQ